MRQVSPAGGSTLMTSAPKSDRITAAPGPAMKLARSTTFKPEKMLSVVMCRSLIGRARPSPALELWRPLLEERRRAFLLVFRPRAEAEVRGLQREAFSLAPFEPLVHGLERERDGQRRVREDLVQHLLRARGQLRGGNDFVDEADAVGLRGGDGFPGEDELQGPALADQAWEPLRPAAAGEDPELHFRLAELRGLGRDADRAGHRRLAAAAQREAVHGGDHGLAEVLDEVEH